MTTTNDEVTGTVCEVNSLPDGKWRLIYQGDGVEGLTATQPLNSHPGVESGDRIRIQSNPPNPLRVEKLPSNPSRPPGSS